MRKERRNFIAPWFLAAPDKESLVVEAQWPGKVGRIPRGDNGFGYDPLFIPDGSTETANEMSSEEKTK